ncbi:related to Autophagy-related protein 3 [Saccharomycodes ludwigii]|uniref:Autophagy-related protein 3 n=1 Tax=Saccharomycodes ludwigii TaxID=36035 RepID=A0A376B2E4_9ASCO|nr:related to Autophagy-related protein 3 [Saccharomycodes ludwigii]
MIRSTLSSWREYLTPISHKSTFRETGMITPEEFVASGDYLQHMFPTWKWNGTGIESSENPKSVLEIRDFLPLEKQFLVTRKVVCDKRISEENMASNAGCSSDNFTEEEKDGWVLETVDERYNYNTLTSKTGEPQQNSNAKTVAENEIQEILDDDDDIVTPYELVNENRRYYDLYITYSTSYRVPKMYLVGFDSNGLPLTPDQMLQDISPDYRAKTATIETLPVFKKSKKNIISISIHPCKHANVMKMLINRLLLKNNDPDRTKDDGSMDDLGNEDDWEVLQDSGLRVDQYLIVFLKFISSVTPGIQYDYTMEGL